MQQAMVADLDRNNVNWIILAENGPGDADFIRRDYQGSERLDQFIRKHFQFVIKYGRYTVLRRGEAVDGDDSER